MIRNNRITVDYSLSVLERTTASKLIMDYEKEYIKPYQSVFLIRKAALYLFGFAALFNFLVLVQLILTTTPEGSVFARIRLISIIVLCIFGISLILFKIYDTVNDRIMRKHEISEQEDQETQQKVKLNRYFLEVITNTGSGKTYWKDIKASYRKKGFIFIHMLNDRCVVIPERIFPSENERVEIFNFIELQIAQNKQKHSDTI